MTDTRVVIVTGASGWIGRNICGYLKETGCQVIACDLQNNPGPWDEFIELDISVDTGLPDRGRLSAFPAGEFGYTLIHCAGYAHRPIETPEEKKRFFAINAEGTRRVIDWARTIGVKRFLYLSSIAFYDWPRLADELPVTEDARLVARTAYAKSKLDGEKFTLKSGLDSRVVRLATVFGTGDRANFRKLSGALKKGRFILPGEGTARKSVISVEFACKWIVRFALMEQPQHRLINLGFGNTPTLREICEAYHEVCGFRMPKSMPMGPLRTLARIGNLMARIKPNFPLTALNVDKLTQSTWVDCSKALELFPELGSITFSEALKESADFYRNL